MSKTYDEMTDAELKDAAREIISNSQSDDEVKQRLASELRYPHEVIISSHLPTDDAGKDNARADDQDGRANSGKRRDGYDHAARSRRQRHHLIVGTSMPLNKRLSQKRKELSDAWFVSVSHPFRL